jgi:hypothetical protein
MGAPLSGRQLFHIYESTVPNELRSKLAIFFISENIMRRSPDLTPLKKLQYHRVGFLVQAGKIPA